MNHDGQAIEELLSELGIKKGVLAKKLSKNQNTITRMLKKEKLSNQILLEIGQALRFDLTPKFHRLKKDPESSKLNYFNEDPDQLLSRVNEIEEMYNKTTKEKADVDQAVQFLQEQINNLKEIIEAKNQIIQLQDQTITDLRNKK
ncbi:hypothetical protein [Reichenbachiella sp. MALMAid0571]|uniref:hypothetical protein n=1 Tax=Reichenbachiella sp. MALMAid0571 TaxID=3143939 RepID=UPI0032DF25B0